jgi:hypothetical protein
MTDMLKARLDAIDADCESRVKTEVDELYEGAYYDGIKFHVPSPQAAEAIWLRLVARKERALLQEIDQVLEQAPAALASEASDVEETVNAIFAVRRYQDRMQDFYREVAKKALQHEPSFDQHADRLDLLDTMYRAGIAEALRKARGNVLAKLGSNGFSGMPRESDSLSLSEWRQYSQLNPWRPISIIFMLSLMSYLMASIIGSDMFREFLEQFGLSLGSGL